jgi:CheY-like chemotaxis protein
MVSSAPARPARILVVEDEPLVAQLLAEVLMADGYAVDTAPNGLVALEKIRAQAHDLVLSDLRMPELDGPGLYRALERERPALLDRLLFISGTLDQPGYREFLETTRARVLTKPFGMAALRRVVAEMLAGG